MPEDTQEVDAGESTPKSPTSTGGTSKVLRGKNGKPLKGAAAAKAKAAIAKKNAPVVAKQQEVVANAAAIIAAASAVNKEKEMYRSCTGVLTSDPMARDVKISGVTLTSWSQELISDSSIELTIGRRYGLLGPNGCGKSTFLKMLAAREVRHTTKLGRHFIFQRSTTHVGEWIYLC